MNRILKNCGVNFERREFHRSCCVGTDGGKTFFYMFFFVFCDHADRNRVRHSVSFGYNSLYRIMINQRYRPDVLQQGQGNMNRNVTVSSLT